MSVPMQEQTRPAPQAPPQTARKPPGQPQQPSTYKRWPPGARGTVWLWQGAALAAGLVLGGGQILGGAAPFGLALALGCAPGHMLAAAAGAVLGALLFLPLEFALGLAGAITAALMTRTMWPGRLWPAAAAAAALLLAEQLMVGAVWGFDVAQSLLALGTVALAGGLAAAIRRWGLQTPPGACLWVAMAAVCAQQLPAFGLAPGLLLAAAAGLCTAWLGTPEQSAVLGVVLAAAFTAADPQLCGAAVALACGTLAASFMGGDRWRCAGLFLAGCAFGALSLPDAAALPPLLSGAACGAVLFLLLPVEVLHQLFPAGSGAAPTPAAQAAQAVQTAAATSRRLNAVANALTDVAQTVNDICARQAPPRGESFDFVVDYTARRLCTGCERREQCWVRNFTGMMDALYHLKPLLETRGKVQVDELGGALTACIHPADLCMAAAHGYRLWRSRRQTRAQVGILRTALTEQYTAVAGALAALGDKLGQSGLPDPKRQARAAQALAALGLEVLECSVSTDLAGRMAAAVTLPRTHFTPEELAALAAELGRACRRELTLPDVAHCRTVTTLLFTEQPQLRAVFGAAGRPAAGQTVSGDACDQFCDSAGRAQMLLCDGMGTGPAAAVDGRMAAQLTARLLRAGFAAESAARLVNVALCLKNTDQESGATLDLLTVDLYTGRAGLYKAGAAPSFLVRGGVARALEGASLPIGVLDTVTGRSTTLGLGPGDMVVMVSDGALPDGNEWLLQQLTLSARLGQTPAELAQTLVDIAARRAAGRRDDITATVLKLERI